jgi:16S rRNA A1518/A1519 N6-dimethyltransferase RsmA/KsgA/DIM1 with predicted DNA glycosylase/AP lyase activity
MGRISFENFGLASERGDNPTVIASRYGHQRLLEKNIVFDIVKKTSLKSTDTLLDIGCNVGNISIPLSFVCNEVAGIDHSSCLKKLKILSPCSAIRLISGNFLDINIKKKYDKTFVYSVLQYLANQTEVFSFIEKCLTIIKKMELSCLGTYQIWTRNLDFIIQQKGKDG